MGAAAEAVACPKSNKIPERVARMDAPDRIAWLKTPEAVESLTGSRRRQLKRRWLEEAGGTRTPGHEVIDPAAQKVQQELALVRSIARMRAEAPRGTVDGIAPCGCSYCHDQRAHWPRPYVDARPRAYECHLEHNPPAEEEQSQPNRTYGERVNKGDATRLGLTERDANHHWAGTLTGACEGCGRKKAKGAGVARYCVTCREEVIETLTKAGWTADKIRAFLDPRERI